MTDTEAAEYQEMQGQYRTAMDILGYVLHLARQGEEALAAGKPEQARRYFQRIRAEIKEE
jgi:hypothetical protein